MAEDGRRAEGEERGPGAAYGGLAVMEGLLDKLKLLDHEEELLAKHNGVKSLSRWVGTEGSSVGSWGASPAPEVQMLSLLMF